MIRHTPPALAALLFVLVWASCVWFGSWELNPNNATRMFAADGLIEDGDASIDRFAALTIDKARFGDHYYLDKAPGMTLMALPAVAAVQRASGVTSHDFILATGFPDFTRYLQLRQRAAVAIGPALLTATAAVLLLEMGAALTGSIGGGLFGALGYALGTPAWGWSTTVFGHAAVAALYLIAVWAIWRATEARVRPFLAGVAGVALGWSVVVEYQAVLAGAVIGLWGVWRVRGTHDWWRFVLPVAVGGMLALVPLVAYDEIAFETPLRIGYSGVVGFEGMNQGLFGLTGPKPGILLRILFGPRHGLFFVAPILLAAPYGLVVLGDRRDRSAWAWMAGAVTIVVLLVNAAYVYWDGGNATGPRLSIPLVGILSIGLAPFWASVRAAWWRALAVLVLAASIALNAVIAAAEITAPPTDRFPLWSEVIAGRFLPGELRTIPSDFFGWSPWTGFALWVVIAVPMLAVLVRLAGRSTLRRR